MSLKKRQVLTVARVENPYQYCMYLLKKSELDLGEKKCIEIRQFHGTRSKNALSIVMNNFDWRLHGTNVGQRTGQGVYFSRLASFASCYAKNCMFVVRVLVTEFSLGDGNTILPENGSDTSTRHDGRSKQENTKSSVPTSKFAPWDTDQYHEEPEIKNCVSNTRRIESISRLEYNPYRSSTYSPRYDDYRYRNQDMDSSVLKNKLARELNKREQIYARTSAKYESYNLDSSCSSDSEDNYRREAINRRLNSRRMVDSDIHEERCLKNSESTSDPSDTQDVWDATKYASHRPNLIAMNQTSNTFLCSKNSDSNSDLSDTQDVWDASQYVLTVARVENPYQYCMYLLKKSELDLGEKKCIEIRQFHGTRSKNALSIVMNNFDWRLHGTNVGQRTGQGVYFSRLASFASCYAKNCMFVVRVLVTEFSLGDGNTILPENGADTATRHD
ncbi:hypothetical protein B566_EDAN016409, partial [Ephemera danica]